MRVYYQSTIKSKKNYLTPSELFNIIYLYHNKEMPLTDLYEISKHYKREYNSYPGFYKRIANLVKDDFLYTKKRSTNHKFFNNKFIVVGISSNGYLLLQKLGLVPVNVLMDSYYQSTFTHYNKHFNDLQRAVYLTDLVLSDLNVPFSLLSMFSKEQSLITLNGLPLIDNEGLYSFNKFHPKALSLDEAKNDDLLPTLLKQDINDFDDYVLSHSYSNVHVYSVRGLLFDELLDMYQLSIPDNSIRPDHLYIGVPQVDDSFEFDFHLYEVDNYTESLHSLVDKLNRYIHYAQINPKARFKVYWVFGRRYSNDGELILEQLDRAYNLMLKLYELKQAYSIPENLTILFSHVEYVHELFSTYIKMVNDTAYVENDSVITSPERKKNEILKRSFKGGDLYKTSSYDYDFSPTVATDFYRRYSLSQNDVPMFLESEGDYKAYIFYHVFNPMDHRSIFSIEEAQSLLDHNPSVSQRMKHYIIFENHDDFVMYRMMFMYRQIRFPRTYFFIMDRKQVFHYNMKLAKSNRVQQIEL